MLDCADALYELMKTHLGTVNAWSCWHVRGVGPILLHLITGATGAQWEESLCCNQKVVVLRPTSVYRCGFRQGTSACDVYQCVNVLDVALE